MGMDPHPLALVTGAAHRLGRAFALSLAEHGYAVLLHYYQSEDSAHRTKDEIRNLGVPAFLVRADLRDASQVYSLFSTLDQLPTSSEANISHLSLLINSAAVMPRLDVRSLTPDDWDAAFDLNLRAAFLCAQQAALRMEAGRGGLIVNISDVGALKTWSRFPAYTVSKAAIESLTRVLARSYAPSVRVNAIAPGLVLPSDNVSPAEWEQLVGRLPLQRPARPEEVSAALLFLLENEYITGQTSVVDGGYSLV
jgi:NAD(P)-dependent dehydrogenase (short-subunit alcohol dehydrogenase family)